MNKDIIANCDTIGIPPLTISLLFDLKPPKIKPNIPTVTYLNTRILMTNFNNYYQFTLVAQIICQQP